MDPSGAIPPLDGLSLGSLSTMQQGGHPGLNTQALPAAAAVAFAGAASPRQTPETDAAFAQMQSQVATARSRANEAIENMEKLLQQTDLTAEPVRPEHDGPAGKLRGGKSTRERRKDRERKEKQQQQQQAGAGASGGGDKGGAPARGAVPKPSDDEGLSRSMGGRDEGSWTRNLHYRAPSGFWGDRSWYDLQLERRLPETKAMLEEMVCALPPSNGKRLADVASGAGRASLAVAAAYPRCELTLLDVDQERGASALRRLRQQAMALGDYDEHDEGEDGGGCGGGGGMVQAPRFLRCVLTADGEPLPGATQSEAEGPAGYDVAIAACALRHIVSPAKHYRAVQGAVRAHIRIPAIPAVDSLSNPRCSSS